VIDLPKVNLLDTSPKDCRIYWPGHTASLAFAGAMGAQAEGATPRDAAIVADACVDAARRIMTELSALRAAPQGRA
jgi:hypothetical protein